MKLTSKSAKFTSKCGEFTSKSLEITVNADSRVYAPLKMATVPREIMNNFLHRIIKLQVAAAAFFIRNIVHTENYVRLKIVFCFLTGVLSLYFGLFQYSWLYKGVKEIEEDNHFPFISSYWFWRIFVLSFFIILTTL